MNKPSKQRYFLRALRKAHKTAPKRLPKLLYPERIEAGYARSLQEMVDFTHSRINARIKPMLPGLVQHYGRKRQDADDDIDLAAIIAAPESLSDLAGELEKVRLEITQAFTPDQIKRLASLTGKSVQEWNAAQLNNQLKGIVEIDLFGNEPFLAREAGAFVVQNVSLIQSIPEEYLSQVEKLIATSVRSGVRAEDISAELEERYGVAQSRANLIARDQIGKLNGQITELRQTELGIDSYTWRDSGDARVRETHRQNSRRMTDLGEGIYSWDDPPATGHPGEDYQCRCWAEPVLAKFFEPGDDL